MKKLFALLVVLVGAAAIVAQCVGLPELLKTGTCASGNTPYVIANPCPSGIGGYVALFGGGLTIAILAIVAAAIAGGASAALLLWGGEFVGVGTTVLIWALTHSNGPAGSKLASYIIAVIFIPMGGFPLLFGLRGALDRPQKTKVSRPSRQRAFSLPGVPGDTPQLPWATPAPAPMSQQQSGGHDQLAKLEQLAALHTSGALTDAEFQLEKSKLLAEPLQ
jgi:hypothetical protein